MQVLREYDNRSGECSILAGLLSEMQGEVSAGREDHEAMPKVQKALHLLVCGKTLAEGLPRMPEKQKTVVWVLDMTV